MTPGLDTFVQVADELLNVAAFDEGEPSNGLLLRAHDGPLRRFAASVNTSFEAIDGAAAGGADLLLVHHATWPYIDLRLMAEKEALLRSHGLCLYGAHASLDCAPGVGTADSLAGLLGVTVEGRFAEYSGGLAGVYGTVPGGLEEFVAAAERSLQTPVRARRNTHAFGRIAIVAGAGGLTNWLAEAQEHGADTYVTGEGSMYTELFAHEVGLNLVLGTHYATEAPGIKRLAATLGDRLSLPWLFVEESNPST